MLEIKEVMGLILRIMSLELWFVWIFIVSFFIIDTIDKRYHRMIGTLVFIFSGLGDNPFHLASLCWNTHSAEFTNHNLR